MAASTESGPRKDSPRYCAVCEDYGDHHTDRHPASGPADQRQQAIEALARERDELRFALDRRERARVHWKERALELGKMFHEAEARAEAAEARLAEAEIEAAKWEGRARKGVTTPPPGFDGLYVTQRQLRLACEQRDEAEASLAAAVEDLRECRTEVEAHRQQLGLQLQAEHERQVLARESVPSSGVSVEKGDE